MGPPFVCGCAAIAVLVGSCVVSDSIAPASGSCSEGPAIRVAASVSCLSV